MSNAKQQRGYYIANPEKFKEKSRKFRKNNPKSCRISEKKWRENNPEIRKEISKRYYRNLRTNNPKLAKQRARANKLWTKYRITLDQEQQMLDEQNHCCKICGNTSEEVGRLVPDHNHTTKRVRGMLCNGCNRGLGQVKENIGTLKTMISYLEEDLAYDTIRYI